MEQNMFHYSLRSPKQALVIGNSEYSQDPLEQCVKDANSVRKRLTNLNFDVTYETNIEGKKMHETIDHFISNIIQPNGYVIFYFSGHGISWDDQNYLIGCDNNTLNNGKYSKNSDINAQTELERHAINVQEKLNAMVKQKPSVVIFLLDCDRQYWKPQVIQGGAPQTNINDSAQMKIPSQTIIVFACAPGKIMSENGIFTKHLLRHMTEVDLDIEIVLRRVATDVAEETKSEQLLCLVSSLTKYNISIFKR